MKKQMQQKTMEYAQFFEEIARRLREDESLDLNNARMSLFTNGNVCQCVEDKSLIRDINRRYFHTDSDVVRGDWLVVYRTNGNVCEIPLTQLYELHKHLEGDMKLVWFEICNAFYSRSDKEKYQWLGGLWEYERRADNLIVRIVPYRDEDYADCVGFKNGDIACILCDMTEKDLTKAAIQQSDLNFWCKEEFDVLYETFQRMMEQHAPSISIEQEGDMDYGIITEYTDIDHPIVLSNTQGIDGATVLYYPNVQSTLANFFTQGDYYSLIPTLECALIFPANRVTEQQVREKLKDILSKLPEDKILSKQVCYYDSKRDSLKVL